LLTQEASANAQDQRDAASDPHASAAQSASLLRSGTQYRRDRMEAADMITTDDAAHLAGTTRVTINAWIKAGRCIGDRIWGETSLHSVGR
jgi:hypothetical protein